MTQPSREGLPICCYCDHVLSCAQCGMEQPSVAQVKQRRLSAGFAQEPASLTAETIEREAKEWLSTGLIDERDKRAVTSFTKWLMKVASTVSPANQPTLEGK